MSRSRSVSPALTSIDPYAVLDVDVTATETEIKRAYRRLALIHHPDKVAPEDAESAHTRFQEIAFAYGVLSDPVRRKTFDSTGSLEESTSEFGWKEFFEQMYNKAITKEMIEEDKKEYRGNHLVILLRFRLTNLFLIQREDKNAMTF